MREAPTVARQVLRALVAGIEGGGTPRPRVLLTLGLTEADLDASGPRLTQEAMVPICERALTLDPALGLHWGERLDERAFGPVSSLLAHTGTLRRGLELLAKFERLFHDRRAYEVIEHADTMVLRILPLDLSADVARFSAEMVLAGMLTMIQVCFARVTPTAVHFAHAEPAYGREYERVFASQVRFAQPHSELLFPRSLLDVQSLHCDRDMQLAMKSVAEQRLARLKRSYALQVRELLLARATDRPTMEAAARALGLSGRSLRRQLAAEGTSYRAIEYAVLEEVAKRLLVVRGLSIKETAHEMGFSDAATFHRAFKTWTGVTPSALRN